MNKLKKITIICFLTFVIFCLPGLAQDEEPASRSITSLDFQAKRRTASGTQSGLELNKTTSIKRKKATAVITNPKRRHCLTGRVNVKTAAKRKSKTKPADKPVYQIEELGVTFWRLRPSSADEEDLPLFSVRVGNKIKKWIAERVASTTKFQKGNRVRFTIESSRTGYLYIVNRELYADGTSGEANLIFPTLRTRGGDNRVQAGSLIEIPSSEDSVSYFTINPQREDYAGEELIILILPDELPNFQISLRAQSLPPENLEKWFTDWESLVDIYDAEDGEGIAYTLSEAQTAKTATRTLTQEEPLPQTIYKVMVKENAPLFVVFRMQANR